VAELLAPDFAHASKTIAEVAEHGVDVELLAADLQAQGATAFTESWESLLKQVVTKVKRAALSGARRDGGSTTCSWGWWDWAGWGRTSRAG